MRYGNMDSRPKIEVGDLATYSTVRAGQLKVKVIGSHGVREREIVQVRVTSRTNSIYKCGTVLGVSSLWLTRKDGK